MQSQFANVIPSAPPMQYGDNTQVQYNVPPPPYRIQDVQQSNVKNEPGLIQFLTAQRWPMQLQLFFIESAKPIYLRYFVYDDSGSMAARDGQMMIGNKKVKCSRWEELCETFDFQMRACNAGAINTKFIFLNKGSFSFGIDTMNIEDFIRQFKEMQGGGTPLCAVVNSIIQDMQIIQVPPGKKIEVVICTDGEASDGDIGQLLLQLIRTYPVKVVLKLCTNEERIVNYWNRIDRDLELGLDIIDDFISEAEQIYSVNPDLCYPKMIHQLREFGITDLMFDHIDEQTFTDQDLLKYAYLFVPVDSKPIQKKAKDVIVYCSVEQRMRPIIRQKSSCTIS